MMMMRCCSFQAPRAYFSTDIFFMIRCITESLLWSYGLSCAPWRRHVSFPQATRCRRVRRAPPPMCTCRRTELPSCPSQMTSQWANTDFTREEQQHTPWRLLHLLLLPRDEYEIHHVAHVHRLVSKKTFVRQRLGCRGLLVVARGRRHPPLRGSQERRESCPCNRQPGSGSAPRSEAEN